MAASISYKDLLIKDYTHWTLYLNEYQCYLGRVCLAAKRADCKDFIDITPEEQNEFFVIAQKVKQALTNLFKPDLMNTAALGNVYTHCHVHLIPRYETERVFNEITFKDARYGSNYAPYDREFRLTLEQLNVIKDALSSELAALEHLTLETR